MPQPRVPSDIGAWKFLALANFDKGLVAHAGGTQAAALQLGAQVNRVDTVATAGDSVRLPKILAQQGGQACSSVGSNLGVPIVVINNGAASMQVFGATPDTINGFATATGVAMAPGTAAIFQSVDFTQSSKVGTWWMLPAQIGATGSQFTSISTNTPVTLTGAQMAGSTDVTIALTATLAGAGTLNSATAAQIVAAIPNCVTGFTYNLRIINESGGAFAWTLTTATGITLTGTMSIAQNTWRDFVVTVTNAGTPAVTIQNAGTGTFS